MAGTTAPRELRSLSDLRPDDHVAFVYQSEDEHREVLTAYMRQGLARGERVLYLADAHGVQAILDYLRADGVDVEPLVAGGQLVVQPARETYLGQGTLGPETTASLLRAEAKRAAVDGYAALRTTEEVSWPWENRGPSSGSWSMKPGLTPPSRTGASSPCASTMPAGSPRTRSSMCSRTTRSSSPGLRCWTMPTTHPRRSPRPRVTLPVSIAGSTACPSTNGPSRF